MNPETFFDKFGLLADTPNGVKKLRELILQLAVQGKLVRQDENDEPAAVLLEKIKAEKERLVREGTIRKSKAQPNIKLDEVSFELPVGWMWARLGDTLLKLTDGTHHSPPNSTSGAFKYITAKNIKSQGVNLTNVTYVSDEIHKEIYSRCNPEFDDILYIKDGATTGVVAINDLEEPFSMLSSVALMKPSSETDNRYLLYVFRSPFFYSLMRDDMSGVAITRVTLTKLNRAMVPIAPYCEQRRIVAKVDQLMALCDELEARQHKKQETRLRLNNAALDKLLTAHEPAEFTNHWQRVCDNFDLLYDNPETVGELRKAILQLAVQGKLVRQDENDEPAAVLLGKIKAEKEQLVREKKIKKAKENGMILKDEYIATFPKNWSLSKIVDLGFVTKLAGFEYTKHIKLEDYGEVPVIRAQNVRMNYIDERNLKYIDMNTSYLLNRCALTKKAILMTFIGAGIGDVAIIDKNERWHLAPNVAKIEPFNEYEEKIDIKYFLYYLMSNVGRYEIFKFRKSTAQPSLSMGTIRQVIVALPPLNEQRRIVAKVDQLMALCDELESKLDQSHTDGAKLMGAVVAELVGA